MTHKHITVIGGGTGLSILLRGIKKLDDTALSAVVSVADDGGSSGVLREDLGMLPPGDIRSCLLALANEEESLTDILTYRFSEGRLKGQNIGNLLIAAAVERYGSFEKGIESISNILKIKGKVHPVCKDMINLCAKLENGNIIIGESTIPKASISEKSYISELFLDKHASISDSAHRAIDKADIIIIGPGSLCTSIIPNFLVDGVNDALKNSEALKIYVANVMTQPGETDEMNLSDHVIKLCNYLDGNKPDYVIANSRQLNKEELKKYLIDGAFQLVPTDEDRQVISNHNIKLIEGDFIETKIGYIRHDSDKVASIIDKLYKQKV